MECNIYGHVYEECRNNVEKKSSSKALTYRQSMGKKEKESVRKRESLKEMRGKRIQEEEKSKQQLIVVELISQGTKKLTLEVGLSGERPSVIRKRPRLECLELISKQLGFESCTYQQETPT